MSSKSKSEQQPCTNDKSKSLSASITEDSEAFVECHVKNSNLKHDVKDAVPMADCNGVDDLADRLARCMSTLVQEAKLSSDQKTMNEVTHFQPLVSKALGAVIKRRLKSWSTSQIFDEVQVRQGTKTTTPMMNFTRCNINSIIDVSIVVTAKEGTASVIGVCEVKKQAESINSAIHQQLCATLTKQRSVHRTEGGSWLLPGLVVYADKAFITVMETHNWWHYTAELKSVQRFDFSPVEGSLHHAYSLLSVLSEYTCLLFSDRFTLATAFCDIGSLPYFTPPRTKPLHCLHIVSCTYKTVKEQLLSRGDTHWITPASLSDNEDVVVKTVTIGMYSHAAKVVGMIKSLLTSAAELSSNPNMLNVLSEKMRCLGLNADTAGPAGAASVNSPVACFSAIRNLHVWIGQMPDSKSGAVVTRFVGDRVCTNPAVLELWKCDVNGAATRKQFYEQICKPTLMLIAHGYFHGDIRPPNVVARVIGGRVQFTLIDWDDVRLVSEDRSVQNDNRYPKLSHLEGDERAMLFTVCQLYVTAIIIDRVAHNRENALDLEVDEWQKKKNFWHVPKTLQQKRKIHCWNREPFKELVGAMEPDASSKLRSADKLNNILKDALRI